MRRLLTTTMTIAALLGVVRTAAVAAHTSAAFTAEEHVRIAFLDAAGNRRGAPYFDIDGAYPGMAPRSETVVVHNDGGGPVAHDLRVAITGEKERHVLGDMLVMTVTSTETGAVLYKGSLGDAHVVASSTLAPGENAEYEVVLAWPDHGTNDNGYQGRTMNFTFTAAARSAEPTQGR